MANGIETARPPADYTALKGLLIERAPTMPRRLKQCAVFALAHPQDMALATVAEIALKADVQPSALVRFAQALGYSGFSELQRVFRTQLADGWPDYRARLRELDAAQMEGPAALLAGIVETATTSLVQLRDRLDPTALAEAADVLAAAETIYVVGARRSYPVAAYLGYALIRLGVRTHTVDGVGGTQGETARLVKRGDAVVAVTFTPYAPETLAFAQTAAENGAAVVAVTDGMLSPITPIATAWLEVNEASLGGFRTTAATFAVALALVILVGQARGGEVV